MDLSAFIAAIDTHSHAPADAAQIARFEHELGYSLPADYRAFLQACAGGRSTDQPDFNWHNGSWAGCVDTVGGLGEDARYSIATQRRAPSWPMKPELLWIMSDHGGNPICLRLYGANAGALYFLDHEVAPEDEDEWSLEEAESDDWGYVLPLADSFSAFIAGLYQK